MIDIWFIKRLKIKWIYQEICPNPIVYKYAIFGCLCCTKHNCCYYKQTFYTSYALRHKLNKKNIGAEFSIFFLYGLCWFHYQLHCNRGLFSIHVIDVHEYHLCLLIWLVINVFWVQYTFFKPNLCLLPLVLWSLIISSWRP